MPFIPRVPLGTAPLLDYPPRSYNFLVVFIQKPPPPPSGVSSAVATAVSVGSTVLSAAFNIFVAGFNECTGLEMTMAPEDYGEGGNTTTLKFSKRVSWGNIHLKRGITISDDLWNWHYSYVRGKGMRRDGVITLMDDLQAPAKIWYFEDALPVHWTGPTMDAGQSRVAIEELELAHQGLRLFSPGAEAAELIPTPVSI